jgi:hypothetical protein
MTIHKLIRHLQELDLHPDTQVRIADTFTARPPHRDFDLDEVEVFREPPKYINDTSFAVEQCESRPVKYVRLIGR